MQQTLDRELGFAGLHDFPSRCRLRIYEEEGKSLVAIATELPDNPGTSVTNAASIIAAQVWQMMGRPPADMTFIEHYPKDGEEN